MPNLTARVKSLKGRSPSPAQAMLAGFAANAPRSRHGADADDRRSRRADALNRLPEGTSPELRQFVASQFDLGRDWSHAVAAAYREGRAAVRDAPRELGLSDAERLLCSRLGISESDYRRYNR